MTGRIEKFQASSGQHFSIDHNGVTLSVSRGGRGRTVILCPGLYSTQAGLQELIELLRRDHEVVAFDLGGHGLSSAATRYSFAEFLGNLSAVMAAVRHPGPAPILVGYSLGADLALHYAFEHPGAVSGLVLIDGANPLPEPFLSAADIPEFRAIWENSAAPDRHDTQDADARVLLTAQQVLALNMELDVIRTETLLDRYRDIDVPIGMIMSTSMAGGGTDEGTRRRNHNWRAGIERLTRQRPDITTTWLDADHRLVFTHAPEIARAVASHIGRLPGPRD